MCRPRNGKTVTHFFAVLGWTTSVVLFILAASIIAAVTVLMDWRTGKAIPTQFTRTNVQPMGIAGLWNTWNELGKEPPGSLKKKIQPGQDPRLGQTSPRNPKQAQPRILSRASLTL